MPLDHKQPKHITHKGMHKICGLSSGSNKTQFLGRAYAASHVILKGKRFNHEWMEGEILDTLFGMSENG